MPKLAAILFLGLILSMPLAQAEKTYPEDDRRILVLDPGHGGKDWGAQGPANMTEKQVAMTVAAAMTERLKKTYKVVLTRKDDYQIEVFERSALANHLKADLFISIHTGGSLRSHPMGMALFYYNGPPNKTGIVEKQTLGPVESSNTIKTWEQYRPEQVEKSRQLTQLARKHLTRMDSNLKLTSAGAPLIVMSGADMPGILIEVGYITNPMDAKGLSDEAHVARIAGAICDAIDDFFSNNSRL